MCSLCACGNQINQPAPDDRTVISLNDGSKLEEYENTVTHTKKVNDLTLCITYTFSGDTLESYKIKLSGMPRKEEIDSLQSFYEKDGLETEEKTDESITFKAPSEMLEKLRGKISSKNKLIEEITTAANNTVDESNKSEEAE